MTATEAAEKLASNALLTAVSRICMVLAPPALIIVWGILSSNATGMDRRVGALETAMTTAARSIALLEQARTLDRDSLASFENMTILRLDRIQDSVNGLAASVAGLNAIVRDRLDGQ